MKLNLCQALFFLLINLGALVLMQFLQCRLAFFGDTV